MSSSEFAHIHCHTDFSLLDGYATVKELTEKAHKHDMKYVAVTDHGMGAAYPQLIENCSKLKLKPIFGCEVYTNDFNHLIPKYSELDDDIKSQVRKSNHLILLAKNNTGYKNLVKLISKGWVDGFYYKPRLSMNEIFEHSDGLVCCSACLASKLSQLLLVDRFEDAINLVKRFKEVWPEDYYLEIQMNNIPDQDKVNDIVLKFSDKFSIPLVLTNDVHYCEEKDSKNHYYQLLLNSKGTINKPGGFEFHTDQLWYKTPDEINEIWEKSYKNKIPLSEFEESKKNTVRICEKCNVNIDTSSKFPKIENASNILLELCVKALKDLDLYGKKIYRDRFLTEYQLITQKGFESYFLICKDLVDEARNKEYLVGSGRGSAGGSLICFLLGITEVDPVKHSLLFERFLSAARGGKSAKLQFSEESEILK